PPPPPPPPRTAATGTSTAPSRSIGSPNTRRPAGRSDNEPSDSNASIAHLRFQHAAERPRARGGPRTVHPPGTPKGRLEAFSDGVIAIIITIMVLELKEPQSADISALRPLVPVLSSYLLSFTFVGIYWNNHHHLIHAAKHVDVKVMWANLHL